MEAGATRCARGACSGSAVASRERARAFLGEYRRPEAWGARPARASVRAGRSGHGSARGRHGASLPAPAAPGGLLNVDALASSKEIILCESLFDAMTFWVAGFMHVITSYGVSGFTGGAPRGASPARHGAHVLIAYDADEAGERGAEQVADALARMHIACYRVHFPRGLDANAYARAEATSMPRRMTVSGVVLRGATWLRAVARRSSRWRRLPLFGALAAAVEDRRPSSATAASAAASLESPRHRPHSQRSSGAARRSLCTVGDRCYLRVAIAKNRSPDALRVNLLATRGADVHVDTLDLYVARARGCLSSSRRRGHLPVVSEETLTRDIGAVLLALGSRSSPTILDRRDAHRLSASHRPPPRRPTWSASSRHVALLHARSGQLSSTASLADFTRAGVVGEETNKLVAYLAAVSQKLPEPLAVIIPSASAAGKTRSHGRSARLRPARRARAQYSAMTGQALFYLGETDLQRQGARRRRGGRRRARRLPRSRGSCRARASSRS